MGDLPQHCRIEGIDKLNEIFVLPTFESRHEFHNIFELLLLYNLTILLQKLLDVFLLDDRVALGDVLEEGKRAEERVGGKDFPDALLNLLAFGESEEEYGKHLVDLGVIVFLHIR